MGDSTVDELYERVRAIVGAGAGGAAEASTAGVTPVAPGIRVLALHTPTLPPAAHTNVYLVGPDRGPVAVVDPGSPYPQEQARLDAALRDIPIERVLLTHHHGDHSSGAAALAATWRVPIAAHAATAKRLAGRVVIDEVLADGDEVNGAVCLFTPGHAEGHLVFEVGDAQIAGDMVAGVGTILIDPDDGDMAQYLASLARMRDRASTRLLPAHGPVITDGKAKLTEYLVHRAMREQRIASALSGAPQSVRELVEVAYSDTPQPLWGLAERSALAHLVKLARDGKARLVDGGLWSR